jgi:hypothetical protein
VPPAARPPADGLAAWGDLPHVLRDVFPDPTPDGIAAVLDRYCLRALGAPVAGAEFVSAGVGSVHGLRLADGRRVVVKVHPPRSSVRHLEAMQTVQRHLAAAGFPAPEPLAPPERLGRGIAVAEALLDEGGRADAHDPAIRRAMAASLARLVALSRPFAALDGLHENLMAMRPDDLWPVPHESRFDFAATAPGAEWIDAVARRARRARDRDAGDVVVGHADWRVENLRFARGAVSAVYDWDSLTIQREPVLAGGVAHLFTSDFAAGPGWVQRPTLEEALAFVADYEAARGTPFSASEWAVARAALLYAMAYTARCEHSDALTESGTRPPRDPADAAGGAAPPGSARAFVAAHAGDLLGERGRP